MDSSTAPETLALINTLDPSRHEIREVEKIRWLRERLKFDQLFLYFHHEARTWVIAYWVNRQNGWFAELHSVLHPDLIDANVIDALERWRHGKSQSARDFRRQIVEEERAMQRALEEQNALAVEAKRAIGREVKKHFGNIKGEDPEWEIPGFQAPIEPGSHLPPG